MPRNPAKKKATIKPAAKLAPASKSARTNAVQQTQALLDNDEVFRLMWEIPRLCRLAMDRRLKPLGLSEAKWRTVLHLSRGPKDMSQAELANRLGIEAPTLARLLDRLAAHGWIERQASAGDRRVKTIHLLPKASGVIREINRTITEMRAEILTDLSRADLRHCVQTLKRVHRHAELAALAS